MAFNSNLVIQASGEDAPILFGEDTTQRNQGPTNVEAMIECYEFDVALETGQQGMHGSSQATGHRIWRPARFVLRLGKSTPWLFEAARMNKPINLTLNFHHRHSTSGEIEQNFQYRVVDGRITSIAIKQPNTLHPETASLQDYVELNVVPNRVEVESMTGGTLSVDDWADLGVA